MGEALGPGDLPAVFQCLKGALSQNTAIQKEAEAALHALETRPGFCSCLVVSPAARPPVCSCLYPPGNTCNAGGSCLAHAMGIH